MSSTTLATTDKQIVLDRINRLPDSATLKQMSDEIAMLSSIQAGLDDIEAGREISNEEAKRRSASWLSH